MDEAANQIILLVNSYPMVVRADLWGCLWCVRAVGLAVNATASGAVYAQSQSSSSPVPGSPAGTIAFVNVTVIPMDTERVLPQQTVLVEGGRVIALRPAGRGAIPANALRIDGRGKFLIPGLADMHVHLGLPGLVLDPQLASDSMAERRLLRLLAQGITTVRNMDYLDRAGHPLFRNQYRDVFKLDGSTVLRLRARAEAGELLSPRIYTAGQWAPEHYVIGPLPRGAPLPRLDSVAAYVTAYKAAGYDFLKVRNEAPEVFDSVLAVARRIGLVVAGHVPDGVSPERALAAGMQSIEHLSGYSEHVLDRGFVVRSNLQELVALTKRNGVWNCVTRVQSWRPSEIILALQAAGAGLLLGTDYPVVGEVRAVHGELLQLVRVGLTPYQALAAGTKDVAVYLGTLGEAGTIAVGKRADLVLLNGNPLQDIRHTMERAGVMIGGRWLAQDELNRRIETLEQKERYARHLIEINDVWSYGIGRDKRPQVLEALKPVHQARQLALLDSLRASPDSLTGHRYLIDLLAQQLGEVRAALSAKEHAQFDRAAHTWLAAREAEGYHAEIRGMGQ
jgi:imidazolonepropionase-like amidohydrolase